MPDKLLGTYDTEGPFVGWGEMAVIRGEMVGLSKLVAAQKHMNEYFEEQLREFVFGLRYRASFLGPPDGVTWAEIGEVFGVSRQAIQQRFGAWVGEERDRLIEELARESREFGRGEDGE
jgi:hypothetical protein